MEATEQLQSESIAFKPKSYQGPQDNAFHMAEILHQRLDSLNNLVTMRASLSLSRISSGIEKVSSALAQQNAPPSHDIETKSGEDLTQVHCLASRDPHLPPTDAGQRLEILFDRYNSQTKEEKAPQKASKRRQGLNHIQVKRGERRKVSIQTLQNQLKGNSSRYLSRSANSLRFRLKKKSSCQAPKKDSDMEAEEVFPIPVSEFEMNPHLFLTLSCEKLALDRGKRLLTSVVLHQISQKLFVLMYWFIHCRFFQVRTALWSLHYRDNIRHPFSYFTASSSQYYRKIQAQSNDIS